MYVSENVTTCTVLDGARGGGGGCSTRIEKLTVLTRLAWLGLGLGSRLGLGLGLGLWLGLDCVDETRPRGQ